MKWSISFYYQYRRRNAQRPGHFFSCYRLAKKKYQEYFTSDYPREWDFQLHEFREGQDY